MTKLQVDCSTGPKPVVSLEAGGAIFITVLARLLAKRGSRVWLSKRAWSFERVWFCCGNFVET